MTYIFKKCPSKNFKTNPSNSGPAHTWLNSMKTVSNALIVTEIWILHVFPCFPKWKGHIESYPPLSHYLDCLPPFHGHIYHPTFPSIYDYVGLSNIKFHIVSCKFILIDFQCKKSRLGRT